MSSFYVLSPMHNQIVNLCNAPLHKYAGIDGFSRTSLFVMRKFYTFFSPTCKSVAQPVGQTLLVYIRTLMNEREKGTEK